MTLLVDRTVNLTVPKQGKRDERDGLSLADFRSDHCYVLLGDPGLGKSTEFEEEARKTNAPKPVTARRFIRGAMNDYRGDGPLFIDGLDEMRTSGTDPREPLDRILERLGKLGNPSFRLSCRTGIWLESGDGHQLALHTGTGQIPVLQLNELSIEDVKQIVASRNEDAGEFISNAWNHGLYPLLWNPQLLDIVLKSVWADGWPSSPAVAFDDACKMLLREINTEHLDSRRGRVRPFHEAILGAAGELFALMLVAGKEGWTEHATNESDFLSLDELNGSEAHLAALNSGLFRGPFPIHMLYAEYLGAKYLDGRIRSCNRVTVRRVLSLLMGHDAVPLPDVRGLAAWLASLNAEARKTLIRVDPIAVAFNGDATNFGDSERRELLENLEQHPEFDWASHSRLSLGALSGRQGLSAVLKLTETKVRTDSRQHLVFLLLSGYSASHGASIEPAGTECEALVGLIRDDTWRDEIRCNAINVLSHLLAEGASRAGTMLGLARKILKRQLLDKRNKLLGTLLSQLYPGDLQPIQVWAFLKVTPTTYIGQYDAFERFWDGLADKSGNEQVRALLDSLCNEAITLIPKLADHGQEHVVLELLAKGLEKFGDEMSTREIFRWFDLVDVDYEQLNLVPAHISDHPRIRRKYEAGESVQNWLQSRQRIQYELIEYGLRAKQSRLGQGSLALKVGCKYTVSEATTGFRQWCLSHAVALWDTQPLIAEELASWSIWSHDAWGAPLSRETIAKAAHDSTGLNAWFKRRLVATQQLETIQEENRQRLEDSTKPFRKRRQAELAAIRQQAPDLARGRCKPALLHVLAQEYLDGLAEIGSADDPITRLTKYLDGDPALVNATLAGLRSLLDLDDLPNLKQIAELHEKNRFSLYTLPFLAGMEEVERGSRDPLDNLDGEGVRRALGFNYVAKLPARRYPGRLGLIVPAGAEAGPSWYQRALSQHPRAVADALVSYHNAQVRMKAPPDQYIFDLGREPEYEPVAALALRRMFTVFPSRCTRPQVESLRAVLWAAICTGGMSANELRDLVLKRLRRKGLDLAQRAHWICAGLFVVREPCLPILEEFLKPDSQVRVRHVCNFFDSHPPRMRDYLHLAEWPADDLARLIRVLGRHLQRTIHPNEDGLFGYDQMVQHGCRQLVTSCIQILSGREDNEAAGAFTSLVSDPDLGRWRPELKAAQKKQSRVRRKVMHKVLSLQEILDVLRGGRPASAADLAALVVDMLEQLADRIRNDATSDWLQYWNLAPNRRKLDDPLHENDCRDRLASDLALMLQPYNVVVDSEPTYADAKRADIRVTVAPDLAIPIEIKRNMHKNVWHAIEEQLVAKYSRSSESGGYGIYVVFWFRPELMRSNRGTSPPETPAALKLQLEAGLSAELRAKIGIVVIDVSPSGRFAEE